MELTTIELRKLSASEGMVLTNGEAYGAEIYLGVNDKPENWREITQAEYEEIMAACGANYDFTPVQVTDENGVTHTAYGGGNNDHEVM